MKRGEPAAVEQELLLRRLSSDGDDGWEQYRLLRQRLVKFFECNNCPDGYALADEVLDRVAKRPDLDQLRSVAQFAIGVARNVARESHRQRMREISIEDRAGGIPAALPDEEGTLIARIDNHQRIACLGTCLDRLDERDRRLALEYYDSDGVPNHVRRRLLAVRFGFTMNALRVHMNRLRERLEREFARCRESRARAAGADSE
jgi:hypothetical protein